MASIWVSVLYLIMLSVLFPVSSERIKDKMYESIEGASACFRRLNGTQQFGCSSLRSGNVGVIHIIENQTELNWLVDNATAEPYMAVIHPDMFTREVMLALKASGKVNGVVLVNGSDDAPKYFTHDDTCPNRYSGLSLVNEQTCDSSAPWNPHGTNLMQVDWGFPIFHVGEDETISKLYECYQKHNAHNRDEQVERSLCALEMNSFMLAAVDSQTCMRRSTVSTLLNHVRFCDPLGDRNIWYTLYPRFKPEKTNKTVIVVAARMDGTSMFEGLVPGAVSPVSGIVTLLMTAGILASLVNSSSSLDVQQDKNVLFVLFNGESYDYIGSSRIVWDMEHGSFPMKPNSDVDVQPPPLYLHNIDLFVELEQISTLGRKPGSDRTTLYLHQPKFNKILVRDSLDTFVTYMNEIGSKMGIDVVLKKNSVPPASLQNFLKVKKDIPGVVVADHESQYLNTFYHSIMDDSRHLNYTYQNGSAPHVGSIQTLVANLSLTLAQVLYRLVSENTTNEVPKPDPHLVDELFHCYLDTLDCPLFRAVSNKKKLETKPATASFYVGVNGWLNTVTSLTGQTLALLVNQTINLTEENCHSNASNKVFQYIWMRNNIDDTNATGVCVKTTMNYSTAVSPAFYEIPNYDWTSGTYSTWTESIWRDFSVRMFLKPSRGHEKLTLSLGVVVLILSFLIVYFANSRSHILFGNTLVTSSC